MREFLRKRAIWISCSLLLSFAIVLHGLYFDYGDRYIHLFLAVLLFALSFVIPRISVSILAIWLFLVSLCYYGVIFYSSLERPLKGTPREEVLKKYGEPYISEDSLEEAVERMRGDASPSPLRFSKFEKVDVYLIKGESLWIFYQDDSVIETFTGGS